MKVGTRLYIVNRDSVKCSYKVFFQMYCSRCNAVNVLFFCQQTLEKVQKTSRFAIVLIYPQKTYMKSIRRQGVANCLLLCALGWCDHQEKTCKSLGYAPGGHGNRSNQVSSMDILRVRFFTKIQIRIFNPKTDSSFLY